MSERQDRPFEEGYTGNITEAGRSMSPSDLPEPEEERASDPSGGDAGPRGLPISLEEYKRRKQEARTGKPYNQDIAQEDPSA